MVLSNVLQFPRVIDCLPPLPVLPGCSVPAEEIHSSSLSYSSKPSESFRNLEQAEPQPFSIIVPSPSDDEDIAIPSGMPSSTRHSDLPSLPPPSQYWKLKKLDPSANVMDYWIRSSREWDVDGIESDISVCLKAS